MKITDGSNKGTKSKKRGTLRVSKKAATIAVSATLGVLLIALVVIGVMRLAPKPKQEMSEQTKQQIEQVKKTYENAGIKLEDKDIQVKTDEKTGETQVAVSDEKRDQATSVSDLTLDTISSSLGDYFPEYGDQPSGEVVTDPTVTDIPEGAKISMEYVLGRVNLQLGYANSYLSESMDTGKNPIYAKTLSDLLDAMRSGRGNEKFDGLERIKNQDAFKNTCMLVSSASNPALGGSYPSLWNENGIMFDEGFDNTIFYNLVLSGEYENSYGGIALLTEDDSKTVKAGGTEMTSSYAAVTDTGKTVYLDGSLTILDID